jgi:hypothetical protein
MDQCRCWHTDRNLGPQAMDGSIRPSGRGLNALLAALDCTLQKAAVAVGVAIYES